MNFLLWILIALVVIAVMLLVRLAVQRVWPTWGTVWANAVGGIGVFIPDAVSFLMGLLGEAQALPWSSILDAAQAQAVVFGILVANMIMRKLGAKAAV